MTTLTARQSQKSTGGAHPGDRSAATRAVPALLVAVVAGISLTTNGVALDDTAAFAAAWLITSLVPGTLIFRRCFGSRQYLVEDLAFGAATGLALEIIVWNIGRRVDLLAVTRWWWLVVIVCFAVVPPLRRFWTPSTPRRFSMAWSWATALICVQVIVAIDVLWFRTIPLPPATAATYHDLWWHLSLVHEMLRAGPTEVPQVAGEAMSYHTAAHTHVAVAADRSGLAPELVLFRLYIIPIALTTVGVISATARQVCGRTWSGPVAAWISLGALAGGSLWPDVTIVGRNPVSFLSPSQVVANVLVVAAAAGLLRLAQQRYLPAAAWVWLIPVIVAASGAKPTVVAILLGGSAAALLSTTVSLRRAPIQLVGAVLLLLGLFASIVIARSGNPGASNVLFGSLRSDPIYRTITGDTSPRGINDGLVLDSLTGPTAIAAALLALAVFAANQAVRLIGLGGLAHRDLRSHPTTWWLGGAVTTALIAFFVIDQAGFGQAYFIHTAVPFGAMMTLLSLTQTAPALPAAVRRRLVAAGIGLGTTAGCVVLVAVRIVDRVSDPGTVARAVLPFVVVAVVSVVGVELWRRRSDPGRSRGSGWIVVVASTIGAAIPAFALHEVEQLAEWFDRPAVTVDASSVNFVSEGEQTAALWLRSHSEIDDIVVTNLHCRPADSDDEFCDARGYWLGGLSGRRSVLEGWAYTRQTQELRSSNTRSSVRQAAPWPDRLELSRAAVESPTVDVLRTLRIDFDADWVVAVTRAGEPSPRLRDLAEPVFDNGEVAIFELREPPGTAQSDG